MAPDGPPSMRCASASSMAMSAVVDANITTIIAAAVLLFFGTGSVQGFATTLLLGVIASMLTAILITLLPAHLRGSHLAQSRPVCGECKARCGRNREGGEVR